MGNPRSAASNTRAKPYKIVAVYPDREDTRAHRRRYTDLDTAGVAAVGLALRDAHGHGGNHLVRNDILSGPRDVEAWCADSPTTTPIWAVRRFTARRRRRR